MWLFLILNVQTFSTVIGSFSYKLRVRESTEKIEKKIPLM